jgi:DNA polymerase-3 subunit epsilon/ATP-dependent DNA helicase DinG
MPAMDTLIALDIETTGLDPEHDAIIEIGAVRFRPDGADGDALESWHSLVNPGRPLSAFIIELTGIQPEEVDSAPGLAEVVGSLVNFVGDRPIVGHNIGFDLAFFQRRALFRNNWPLDTVELASILFPNAGRYTLSALVQELGLGEHTAHRGLADALAARSLYLALRARALALRPAILAEIVAAGRQVDWTLVPFFEAALDGVLQQQEQQQEQQHEQAIGSGGTSVAYITETRGPALEFRGGLLELAELFPPEPPEAPPLRAAGPQGPLDVDALAGLVEPGGELTTELPDYEHRPQQVAVLRAIAAAFNAPHHLLVEAGTGIGKSLAYLIPAIHWAVQNGQRVVVATNTIALQDQLLKKDLPDLQRVLPFPFRASVLKGRTNYVCPRRLEGLRHSGPSSPEEMRLLAKLLVWLPTTATGDRAELTLLGPAEQFAWSRLSAETEGCTAERCATFMGGLCPFWRARLAADSAHVIIVSHALLLADVATGSRVLPDYRYLIVDEAHHLEQATTQGLSFQANRALIDRVLSEIGGSRLPLLGRPGLLAELARAVQGALPEDLVGELQVYAGRLAAGISALEHQMAGFFALYADFLAEQRDGLGFEAGLRLLLDHAMRLQPPWTELETAWEHASVQLFAIIDGLGKIGEWVSGLEYFEVPDWEDLLLRLLAAQRELTELRANLNQVVAQPSPSMIYWAEAGPRLRGPALHAAPLHVGPLVEQHLFNAKAAVVLTSATLRAGDDFSFVRDRLHAWDAEELAVDSPFDYERSTLLYLVNDLPEPNQGGYQAGFERGLLALCRATRGRALVLFTSYGQLRATSQALTGPLAEAGIVVYEQSDGSSRQQLLDNFREAERAVLLGTRSFWEGVDVPGQALSVLVIPRLPFSVPSDPIFLARSRTFDEPFSDYAVPEAVLRFRQGFGRLIRRQSDRGVVAVFDKRVLTKAYGRYFLDALPACTTRRGSAAQLAVAAQQWLDGPAGPG